MKRASALLVLLLVAGSNTPARGADAPGAPLALPPSPEVPPPEASPWSGLTIGSEVFGISGKGLKSHVGGGGFAEWSREYRDGSFVAFSGGAGFSPAYFPTGGWAMGPGWGPGWGSGWATGYDFATASVRAGQDFGRLRTFVLGELELAKPSAGPAGAPNAMGSIDNVFSGPSRLRARGAVGAGFDYAVTDQLTISGVVSASPGRGPFLPPTP